MGLPQYSGPFNVGAIDLEIPVREPRSFGSEYISNDEINKPKKHKVAEVTHQKAKLAAHRRHKDGESDLEADESKHEKERSNVNDWNPFTDGAKTTTLHLSTVLFTLFYPSQVDDSSEEMSQSNVSWMGRPKRKTLAGFLQYMGSYGSFAYMASPAVLSLLSAKIPATAGAHLADPNSEKARAHLPYSDKVETGNFGGKPAKFPLIIFSHGLAGSRLSYSQFCGELASHGVIVAAMEHRDGSGISSLVRVPQPNSPINGTKAGKQPLIGKLSVPYFAFENVGQRSFAEDPSEKEAGLRKAQMAMRTAEIMECLYIIQQIDSGKGEEIANSSTRGLTSKLGKHISKGKKKQERSRQEAERLSLWKGKVDAEYPCLAGHSFGACTVIEMQRRPEKTTLRDQVKSPFPFSILLDPWVEPLEWRGEGEDPDPRPMIAPAFAINSESFTIWRDHFSKLKRIMHDSREVVDGRHGWLFTLCGCQHLDFSDFPFLLPHIFRSTVGPKQTISVFCRATYSQMGLIRQRRRDEEALPGIKTGDIDDTAEESKKGQDEAVEASSKGNEGEATDEGTCKRGQFGTVQEERGDNEPSSYEEKKDQANDAIWQSGTEKEKQQQLLESNEKRRKIIMEERKKRGLVAVFANRSPSGNIDVVKDGKECIDFSEIAKDVSEDEDAGKVHKSLEDISRRLDYKKPKVLSLMGVLLRLNGLHPGLANPGKVLIHQY